MAEFFFEISDAFLKKWQNMTNLLSEMLNVSSALILKSKGSEMEVIVNNTSPENPLRRGYREKPDSLCENEINRSEPALAVSGKNVSEAKASDTFKSRGLIRYIELPVHYPDNSIFGKICTLDKKKHDFNISHYDLILQFKHAIELDLALILSMDNEKDAQGIIFHLKNKNAQILQAEKMTAEANMRLKTINEELIRTNKKLSKQKDIAHRNEALFRTLFESSPIGMSMTSPDGTLHVNGSFRDMLGYSKDEMKSMNWQDITLHEDIRPTTNIIRQFIKGEIEKIRFEKRYLHKDGSVIWADLSAHLQRDKDNKPHFFITAVQDITAKKKIKNELLFAKERAEESDRLKTAFLQNISHEIRTPLNSIIGFSKLLVEKCECCKNEVMNAYSDMISQNGKKLIRIISDILDMSHVQTQQAVQNLAEENILNLIKDIKKEYQKKADEQGLEFFVDTEYLKDPIVQTDGNKLLTVLHHLLDNALKFTLKGSLSLTIESKGDKLYFSVRDTGIGISEEFQKEIFKVFSQLEVGMTRTFGGNGVGLALVSAYVSLLNGELSLDSKIDKGTVVRFCIPQNFSNKTSDERIQNPLSRLKGKTVIIAGTDASMMNFVKNTLTNKEVKVAQALTGRQLINLCRNNAKIDLILTEIELPELSGIDAAKMIKAFNPAIPVIVQTANFMGDNIHQYIDVFDDYLIKPLSEKSILKKICVYIND